MKRFKRQKTLMTLNFFHVLVLSKAFIENYPKLSHFSYRLDSSHLALTVYNLAMPSKLGIFYC